MEEIISPNIPVSCTLYVGSSPLHLTQIFTGLGMLESKGVIKVRLEQLPSFNVGRYAIPRLRMLINKNVKVVYDTSDGRDIDSDDLGWADFYFKRSYDRVFCKSVSDSIKIHPLGLYYLVYGRRNYLARLALMNILSIGSIPMAKSVAIVIAGWLIGSGSSRVNNLLNFEGFPQCNTPAQIIFFSKVWDPDHVKDPELKNERYQINDTRVKIIAELKKKYGQLFNGGLEPTEFAVKSYPKYIVPPNVTKKKNYLNLLRNADICVTTRGLMDSNGGKLAEYVAGAKAIVTEKIRYEVTGDFVEGENYLSFLSPQECIKKIDFLLANTDIRYHMMLKNYAYYHSFLRPDMLVWNTIMLALSRL